MKSVLIISVVTFFLIFGGLAVLSKQLGGNSLVYPEIGLTPVSNEETELVMKGLDAERTLLRREKEELVTLRQTVAVQEQVLEEGRRELQSLVQEIENQQRVLVEDRERSAVRLAKMYETMKPAQAAPILSVLELEIVLDIMGRMKEREAARILAQMDPSLAARISTELSGGGAG
jgi:flagellar motility protein MotE (MotC chaperone)